MNVINLIKIPVNGNKGTECELIQNSVNCFEYIKFSRQHFFWICFNVNPSREAQRGSERLQRLRGSRETQRLREASETQRLRGSRDTRGSERLQRGSEAPERLREAPERLKEAPEVQRGPVGAAVELVSPVVGLGGFISRLRTDKQRLR